MKKNKRKPTKQQILKWKLKKQAEEWDKELLEKAESEIINYWVSNGTLILDDWEEVAFFIGISNAAIAQYCWMNLDKQQEICYMIKDSKIWTDLLIF